MMFIQLNDLNNCLITVNLAKIKTFEPIIGGCLIKFGWLDKIKVKESYNTIYRMLERQKLTMKDKSNG